MSHTEIKLVSGVKHPIIKLARTLNAPSIRAERKEYLVEGRDLLWAAFNSPSEIKCVFFSDPDLDDDNLKSLADQTLARGIPCYRVSRGLLFKIIGTSYKTAVDTVAIVSRISFSKDEIPIKDDSLIVVGERIQDPRNVGVMIRTADAVGASVLILGSDSADPFCRAAVRSSRGSILHLPILLCPNLPEMLSHLKNNGAKLISTSVHGKKTYWESDFTGPCCVVFGNETNGVSKEVRLLCDEEISIPIVGSAHSLNVTVASGIVLYEWMKSRVSSGNINSVKGIPTVADVPSH